MSDEAGRTVETQGGVPVWLADRLGRLMREKLGPEARTADIAPLPGHAGLGFSFSVATPAAERRLVIRTIADGVPPTGPADVVRQARIMQAVGQAGIPAPKMLWFENDSPAFGRPYFVGEFVVGEQPPDDWRVATPRHAAFARAGVAVMARLHQLDWRDMADAWGPPRPLEEEFERLSRLIHRPTIDLADAGPIEALADRLLATQPRTPRIGCVHGDMHSFNMIFGDEGVRAVVDWEIALVGPALLDLGWICFYADPQAHIPEHADRVRRWILTPDEMIDAYRAAAVFPVEGAEIDWFRAFSGYRFAAITLFNEMLHRRGKRHDPSWIDTARSVPRMVQRGLELTG